jgi:uroporphyrinogen decarboxylase
VTGMDELWGRLRIAPLMGLPGVRLSGTSLKQNLENADVQFSSLKMLYERFHPDAMFTMMDLSIEVEACGVELSRPENRAFSVKQHPVGSSADLQRLRNPDPCADGRMPLALAVVQAMSEQFDCINAAYVSGPFTLASLLTGAGNALRSVIRDQDFLRDLLQYCTRAIIRYSRALAEHGADFVCILEPTAGILSPLQFEKNSAVYLREISAAVSVPSILHICGDTNVLIPNMLATNCSAISLDWQVNMNRVLQRVRGGIQVLGNIDPVNVVAYGSAEEVDQALLELIALARDNDNLTISTGCDLPLDTNMENLSYLFSESRRLLGQSR